MRRIILPIFVIVVLLSSVVTTTSRLNEAAAAEVSTASPGADKIKVTVKLGSMNFRLIPSGNLFSQYDWEADWGEVEPGGPDVVAGWDVTYVGGSKTGTNEYSLIDQANKVKPDGSFDGLRVWFGPPNPTTGFTKHGTSPFNYPFYPDTSRPNEPEYPITLVEFEECTPMDNVILHVWVAESDSSTANTAVGLLTGLAGVVLTGIGLATEIPSVGTSTGIASLGVGLIGIASGMISQNGDEDWGRASDVKNSPGRYTITTQNGANGKVNLDWAIETEIVEKNSPDCRDQRTSLLVPGYQPVTTGEQALAYFGSMRDLVSQVPVMHDGPGTAADATLASYVMQAVNSTQYASLANMPNQYALSLTQKAEELALEGSYKDAIELYEAAFLATIESSEMSSLSAHASVSPGVSLLSGSSLSTASIQNTGDLPLSVLVVRSLDGDLKYVYLDGWERKRLAHDTAVLWTDGDNPIASGESVSLLSITGGQGGGDMLFRFGTNTTISSTLVAVGPRGNNLVNIMDSALPSEDNSSNTTTPTEFGRIEELAFPLQLDQGRTEEGMLSVHNVNNGYLEILVDTELPFHAGDELIIVNKETGQTAEFTINDSGQLVGRMDIPSDLEEMDLAIKVLRGAPIGVYEIAFFLHGQDGSIHDTDFAEVDVYGEYDDDQSSSIQQGPLFAEPSEVSFAHKVGDTECPQFIGTVFLNADREGEWRIAGQPEWLTIDLDGEAAQFEFNCNIGDTSTHAVEDEVIFVFEGDNGEDDDLEIAIYGEIIGEGEEDYETFAIDCTGGGKPGGTSLLSDADREKYSKVEGNLTQLTQPNGSTCSPTSGAIDLLHWNATIAPGIVNGTKDKLISDLAARMKTTGSGTKTDQIALGMASYLEDHAKGKFEVKFVFKSTKTKTITKTVGTASVKFIPQDGVTILDLASEMDRKANVIVNVEIVGTGGHSVKLMALNTSSKDGKYNVAFINPADGKIMQGTMDFDGNIEAGSDDWKIRSYVAISPK